MRQIEATSPYDTFELYSRTPLPPDLAKTRRFQRDPETTKFARQPVDDTVPFSPFDGAELAILPISAPAERRQVEDDSIEIEIVDSGEIERVAPLEEEPLAQAIQAEASIELDSSALEPLESSFFLPIAIAEPSEIATPPIAAPVKRSLWRPIAIVLFLAAAFACGIGAAFAVS